MKNYTLPKEFGTKWIAALRSGEYKQTSGQLREFEKNEFCYCGNGLAYLANGYEFINDSRILFNNTPRGVWNASNEMPISSRLVDEIIELNDTKNKSFPEIADWIEANVEFI